MIPRYCPGFDIKEFKMLFSNVDNIIEIFEEKFSKLVGCKHAISFSYGRSAFYSIIKSFNISNSEIILPSFSCSAVPFVILETNNLPVFVDISLDNYNMRVNDAVTKINTKIKAIVPIYMYGYPLDIKILREEVNENIIIIEDAALAILTKDIGKYGDIQFYSFGAFKQLHTCNGGIVTTNNSEYYEKIKKFREQKYHNRSFYANFKRLLSIIICCQLYKKWFYNIYNIWHENYLRNFYNN